MTLKEFPDGVWPVMITPFNRDKAIDFNAYKNLIEFYISKNVAGLFACCGSSELNQLNKAEMLELVAMAVEISAGRVPVVGGAIIFEHINEQIEFIKNVYKTGVDAVIVAANQFVPKKHESDTWIERLAEILSVTGDIPMGTYELPVPWHKVITKNEFEFMAKSKRFVFHKDTSCDLKSIKDKLDAAKETKLKIFSAHSPSILDAMKIGVNGYCGTGANFRPDLYVWLYENFNSEPKLAARVQQFLTNIEHRVDECRNYPANAKAFMALQKVEMNNICRCDRPEITDDHIQILLSVLSDSQKMYEFVTKPQGS